MSNLGVISRNTFYPIGTKLIARGVRVAVMEDNYNNCDGCVFSDTICEDFNCRLTQRDDRKDVKFKAIYNDNEEEIELNILFINLTKNDQKAITEIIKALNHAKEKHPKFAENDFQAACIIGEEFGEFIKEVNDKNLNNSIMEGARLGCTIVRYLSEKLK